MEGVAREDLIRRRRRSVRRAGPAGQDEEQQVYEWYGEEDVESTRLGAGGGVHLADVEV